MGTMPGNSAIRWGGLSKAFHWGTVLLVCVAVPAGYLMSFTYPLSLRDTQGLALHEFAGQIHHTIGFLILALTLGRLGWRWARPVPAGDRSFPLQGPISRITHHGLYAILILAPVSGWLALSVFGLAPIWFFNQRDLMPPIAARRPVDDTYGYGFFAHAHLWLIYIGAVLLALHVAAALWHHFSRRDDTLRRMWPLAQPAVGRPYSGEEP
jgi:cytochrome b561